MHSQGNVPGLTGTRMEAVAVGGSSCSQLLPRGLMWQSSVRDVLVCYPSAPVRALFQATKPLFTMRLCGARVLRGHGHKETGTTPLNEL